MLFYSFVLLFSFLVPSFILIKPMKNAEKRNRIEILKKYIVFYIVLILGFLVRLIAIDKFPVGLNCDEASSTYEAYSILNYGIDRNGNFLPVFLEAWGSGQNALYSYLLIPFVKILGVNIFSTRIPMAIISCISLIVWYYLLKNIKDDKKFVLIGIIFLSICPWHIMKSRWGLESNLFPDLALWAIGLLISYLKTKKQFKLYLSFAILGITSYAYGTSYMFLPIFCLLIIVYLLYKKEINIKQAILCFSIVGIISLPIVICVIINTFDLKQINLPFMTIPRLPANRYEEQTTLFSGNIFLSSLENIKNSISLLILQNDGLIWNNIPGFGMYYIISIPALALGLIYSFKNAKEKNEFDYVMNIWFIASFLLLFVFKEANINRINILIFPLVYYISKGLYMVFELKQMVLNVIISCLFIILFVAFLINYVRLEGEDNWTFISGVKDVIEYIDSSGAEKIYFQYAFKEPYIYVLYYTKYDVKKYLDTVQVFQENAKFDNIKSFGRYNFYLPQDYNEKDSLYVFAKNSVEYIDEKLFEIKEFEKYLVIRMK